MNNINSFHPDHLADLRKSGISDETIQVAGTKSVPPRDITKKLGFDIPGLSSMYEIPYPGCEGYSRFKAFYADGEQHYEDGSEKPKYLAKKNSGNRLYIPLKVIPILKDVSIPLYITEGEKKALKAAQEGLPCIAISGLWNWSNGNKELLPDFNQINLAGRTIYLVPDSDWLKPNREGKPKNLKQAVDELISLLTGKGASVSLVKLPSFGSKKIGLDDYLCFCTVEDFEKLPKENDKYNIKISTIGDMLQHEPPEYLIKPILYKNTVNLLQSLSGIGKSVNVLSVAGAITSNKLLWGNFETQKGNVLIIDEENPGSIHRDRIEKMGISKDAPIHFVHYQGVKIDDPKWLEALIKFIDEGKYVLVVFDALIRMHSAKENDSDEMSKVMWGFREIVRRANTTVLIIHHERKSRDGEKRERSRGSGDIIGAIDSQLILEEGAITDDGKELILHPGKTRLKSFAPIRLVLNSDTLNISYVGNVLSGNKEIIQSVIQFLGDGIHDFEEIQQALGIPEKQLRIIIKNALGRELILDSTLKQRSDYKGSPRKQFFKVNADPLFSHVAMFPPIGGETCHNEEKRLSGNKVSGNIESLDSVGCGVVSEHSLPHETWTQKHVSEGAKKTGVGNMENCIEIEQKNFEELCEFFEQKKFETINS